MSPDFRYHIASLAAVFLALGIGILVGTAFVGAPVVDRQTHLIGHLETNVADLRRETAERQEAEEALKLLMPGLVKNRLMGRRVLVIQCGAYASAAGETVDALSLAGAEVERVTLPNLVWQPYLHETTAADTNASTETAETLARRIAPLLAGGANESLADFRQRGLVTGDPTLAGAARYIVLVGGEEAPPASAAPGAESSRADTANDTLARRRDVTLAQALSAQGGTVVGVEPFEAGTSVMRAYESAGIATIDSIDRAVGKLALPYALLGEKGNYGIKSTADRLLPASLEQTAPSASAPSNP